MPSKVSQVRVPASRAVAVAGGVENGRRSNKGPSLAPNAGVDLQWLGTGTRCHPSSSKSIAG